MKIANKLKYLLATPLLALASNAALAQETIVLMTCSPPAVPN